MEEVFVKPGNQERGWNDPPQFSYSLQKTGRPHRNLLTHRPGAGAPPMTPPTSSPLAPTLRGVAPPPGGVAPPPGGVAPPPAGVAPPPAGVAPPPGGVAPPPLRAAPPPPGCVATPPLCLGPMSSQRDSSQSEGEPDVEGVVSVLNRALDACRHTVKEQVLSDVGKRLRLLEESWRSGRLSLPVRRRMENLSLELQACRWDSADDLHRSLMVDHVTEVSQWMVGVKRLIAETRKLSPDLLETLQSPAGPDQDPAGPDQDPAGPDQDPAGPDQDPAGPDQDPAGPDQDPAGPQDSTDPVQDPDQDPAGVQDC